MPSSISERWDERTVFPVVMKYLINKKFPQGVSMNTIIDCIKDDPEIKQNRILQIERQISRSLREMGYRRDSVAGKGFSKTALGAFCYACVYQ
jgi:hypothetical protein